MLLGRQTTTSAVLILLQTNSTTLPWVIFDTIIRLAVTSSEEYSFTLTVYSYSGLQAIDVSSRVAIFAPTPMANTVTPTFFSHVASLRVNSKSLDWLSVINTTTFFTPIRL